MRKSSMRISVRLCVALYLCLLLSPSLAEEEEEEHVETEAEREEECEEEEGGADVILLLFFMLLLGLVVRYALRAIPVPYTALLLVVGMVLGAMQLNLTKRVDVVEGHSVEGEGGEAGGGVRNPDHKRWEKFAIGIDAWQGIKPELMLLVFLPPLIFSSAFSLDFHITKRSFGQVMTLAGPGVVIGTVMTAFFVKYVFPYEWCWPKAFMFGAMISATDPVAVVALLKEVGASKRLGTVIEGESLFNDGTAFVFFLLFRDMIPTHHDCLDDKNNCHTRDEIPACVEGEFFPKGCLNDRDVGKSIGFFLQLALGGPAIGILFGLAATFWIQYIYNDLLTEISVTLVTAYLTFYVAEDVAEVSGVLAVVTLGLFMGSFAKDRVSSAVHEPLHVFWEMMEYIANTLIFVYTGLKISIELFDSTNPNSEFIETREWGYAVLLYAVLQIIRFLTIFSLLPFLQRMGYGMTWKDGLVATWGGLRGAVGLALALIVNLDVEKIPPSFRSYTIFYLGFVVIATLLLNGTTMPYLLKFLGVTKTSPEKLEVLFHLLTEMEDCGHKQAVNCSDDLLGVPDYDQIKRLTQLDISKIVPGNRELETVMHSAVVLKRPSMMIIRENLNRQSLQKLETHRRHSLVNIEEEVAEQSLEGTSPDKKSVKSGDTGMWSNFKNVVTLRRGKGSMSIPDSPEKQEFTPDMLVQDLRARLLQGVKTAYAEWLEKGYISAKPMFDLIASADAAIDRLDQPVCDWRYIERVARPSWWRVQIQKFKGFNSRWPFGDALNKAISKLLFDNMLHSVLLARTFIMAHSEAEHALHEHIKSEIGAEEQTADPGKMQQLEQSVETVLRESKASTKAAYEMLRNFKAVYPEILRAIRTRLSAQEVLLEKQAFVHQIESAGLIEEREATVIRGMIDSKIKFLAYSTLLLELPNNHDLLHSHPLFLTLAKNLFDSQVWPHAKPKVFTKGATIFTLGGEPKHVTIVVRGLVTMIDSMMKETPIGDGFGSVLGVSEIILNRPRSLTMKCETTVEVIQFDRQIFESFIERFVSVRIRAWQLTGMMLTYLSPWGEFSDCSILDLAAIFRNAQMLEFEVDDELRVRTSTYLVTGTVKEAGFVQTSPRTIVAPSPLGPGLGIYNCVTPVKVLRIPMPDGPGHAKSSSHDDNKRRLLSRGTSSLTKMSMPTTRTLGLRSGSVGTGGALIGIPEGSAPDDSTGSDAGDRHSAGRRAGSARGSFDYAMSADLETRRAFTRLKRQSIEL